MWLFHCRMKWCKIWNHFGWWQRRNGCNLSTCMSANRKPYAVGPSPTRPNREGVTRVLSTLGLYMCNNEYPPEGNKPHPPTPWYWFLYPYTCWTICSIPPPLPSHTMTWTFFPLSGGGGGGGLKVGKLQLWIEREIVTFAFEASSVHIKPPLPPPPYYKSAFQFLQQQQISAYKGHLQL